MLKSHNKKGSTLSWPFFVAEFCCQVLLPGFIAELSCGRLGCFVETLQCKGIGLRVSEFKNDVGIGYFAI